jgi:hypothetical protein
MKQICVIGNSHAACLKLAWDRLKVSYPKVALTFFADRAMGITTLEPRNGVLAPPSDRLRKVLAHTSGGRQIIDFRHYDVVLAVGLNHAYPLAIGHYSLGAARRALLDYLPQSSAIDLVRKIRQISGIPIFLAHQPLLKHIGKTDEEADTAPYRTLVDALNADFIQEMGAVLLPQPPQTITNYYYTRDEYAVGSTRLDIGDRYSNIEHAETQRSHMNARFGDIYLSTHLRTVAFG